MTSSIHKQQLLDQDHIPARDYHLRRGIGLGSGAAKFNAFIVRHAIVGVGSAGISFGATVIIARIVPLAKWPISAGLIGPTFGHSSIKLDTNHAARIGHQIVLPIEEVDIGISLTSFAQPLGRVIFMSVSQSLFHNHFMASLPNVQGIDVAKVLAAAAAGNTNAVPAKNLNEALVLCNDGLHRSFLASVAVSCLMSLPAVTMEWRTTKKNNVPVPAVGEDDVSIQRVLGNEPFKCAISHSHLVNIDNVEDGQFVRFGRRPPYSHVSNLLLA